MDIITTSLEALIQRATNVSNQGPDTAAIDAFCGLINKEPECAQMAAKFITAKVHSLQEWEALQALLVLETCMKRCGGVFHAEVGKFRFLNELIKLVSPKYLGAHTPEPVRRRVLELMHLWTVQYPKESKIKEAYDMLKKQGVVKEELGAAPAPKEAARAHSSILQDEELSQLLQKLLRSKNPEDLQTANELIKSMVKEDERRLEEKWKHALELETVVNNCRLLKEMLDNYQSETSSPQDLELIKELHTTCQNLRPVIFKLASNNIDPNFFGDVLSANDELGEVFSKYSTVIQGISRPHQDDVGPTTGQSVQALLDLTPSPTLSVQSASNNQLTDLGLDLSPAPSFEAPSKPNSNYLDTLDDIFSSNPSPSCIRNQFVPPTLPIPSKEENFSSSKSGMGKIKGLEELDMLGESLLKESLKQSNLLHKASGKVALNELNCSWEATEEVVEKEATPEKEMTNLDPSSLLLDEPLLSEPESCPTPDLRLPPDLPKVRLKEDVLPLGDIVVTLDTIKPSIVPPFHALDELNEVSVVIHLAQDCPRPDVAVFVVTTSSRSKSPLFNYLFQPVVPKCCRLRLLTASSTDLPAHNPFLPPAAITQVMLIASPTKEPITLKFVISYTLEEETVTEMGEIENLPLMEPAT